MCIQTKYEYHNSLFSVKNLFIKIVKTKISISAEWINCTQQVLNKY